MNIVSHWTVKCDFCALKLGMQYSFHIAALSSNVLKYDFSVAL